MSKPINDWKNLVPKGKMQKYYHLQTNIPVGHEKEYDALGAYLVQCGLIYENNVCEVLRGCLELIRTLFAGYVKDDIPIKIPPGYTIGPGVCKSDACARNTPES